MSIEHAWEWSHFVAYSMPTANRGKIRPERTVQGKSCSEAGLEKGKRVCELSACEESDGDVSCRDTQRELERVYGLRYG